MRISIIVPMYYGQKYVKQMTNQVDQCAKKANDIEVELILYNDCPEEKIEVMPCEYIQNVKCINADKNLGIHGARVQGLKYSTGEYIIFLDQDDQIADDYLTTQLRSIGDADFVVCRCMNEEKQFYNEVFKFEEAITYDYIINKGCPILSPGQVLIKKDAIPDIWLNNIMKTNCADDYLLWMCMAAANKKIALNENVVFYYNNNGFNTSSNYNHIIESEREMFSVIQENQLFEENKLQSIKGMLEKQQTARFNLLDKFKKMFFVVYRIIMLKEQGINLSQWFEQKNYKIIAIYGASYIGNIIYDELKGSRLVPRIIFIDQNAHYLSSDDEVYTLDELDTVPDLVVFSMMDIPDDLNKRISSKFGTDTISIRSILDELESRQSFGFVTDKKIKLSVIVPIYNGEKFLNRCLDSLLNQNFQDYEIILVNDGSTDQTLDICKDYLEKDKRIRIINKSNTGAQDSRYEGLKAAVGEYIIFVDSDDWIDDDYFCNMMGAMGDADFLASGLIKEYEHRSEYEYNALDKGEYYLEEQLKYLYSNMLCMREPFEFGILPYMWNKIFRREKLLKILDSVNKKIFDGEDVAVVYPYILQSNRVRVTDYTGYHYRILSDSISHRKRETDYLNESYLYEWLYKYFSNSTYKEILIPQLNAYMRMMIWKRNQALYISANKYQFPYSKIKKDANIILYGDGAKGKAYYEQVRQSGYCQVEAIADKKYQNNVKQDRIGINDIQAYEFDCVVIAIEDEQICLQVKKELSGIGISEDKIII